MIDSLEIENKGVEIMITSTSNPRVKDIIQLQKKSRLRNERGVFLVEGLRMAREIPPEQIVQMYATEEFYQKNRLELTRGIQPELVSGQVFSAMSDTKTPQGVLAVVRQSTYQAEILMNAENAHLLVLDNLQDPGNLGTIFRTAEAAGVTGIILSRDCVDIYNPKTVRSTMGAIFRQPFVYVENVIETIMKMKERGVTVYAAHLQGEQTYDRENYRAKTAFLIGNEGNGLRKEVAEAADIWIRIPMAGEAESLNAAVAAAVLMFEVSRQRRG